MRKLFRVPVEAQSRTLQVFNHTFTYDFPDPPDSPSFTIILRHPMPVGILSYYVMDILSYYHTIILRHPTPVGGRSLVFNVQSLIPLSLNPIQSP